MSDRHSGKIWVSTGFPSPKGYANSVPDSFPESLRTLFLLVCHTVQREIGNKQKNAGFGPPVKKKEKVTKNLAKWPWDCEKLGPYRIGKRLHKQNRAKYTKNTENRIFWVFLMCFWVILRVAVFPILQGAKTFPTMEEGFARRAHEVLENEGTRKEVRELHCPVHLDTPMLEVLQLLPVRRGRTTSSCALWLSGPISRDIAILSLQYPISRDTSFGEVSTPPKWCDTPPWYLVSHKHICAIPHFATYRAIIVRYPIKTSTKEFCDTIATSIV